MQLIGPVIISQMQVVGFISTTIVHMKVLVREYTDFPFAALKINP